MEASTLQAPAGLARTRIAIGTPMLRLRSDEQLVALFRAGHDEAFRAIHDRYEKRLLAYTRQMLPRGQDAEDALQDVFVRAYSGLRASDRELALRAWLFRVAHNRCIDELRRPTPPPPEVLQLVARPVHDPVAEADRRESLRRLIVDVRRLPEQQRSALLMREMGGMSYAELACSLGTSVPAVKSLLVRARIALAQAEAARDTACSEIRKSWREPTTAACDPTPPPSDTCVIARDAGASGVSCAPSTGSSPPSFPSDRLECSRRCWGSRVERAPAAAPRPAAPAPAARPPAARALRAAGRRRSAARAVAEPSLRVRSWSDQVTSRRCWRPPWRRRGAP